MKRGERFETFDLKRRDNLWNFKRAQLPRQLLHVDERGRRVRGSEVDAYDVAARRFTIRRIPIAAHGSFSSPRSSRTLNSSFHRLSDVVLTHHSSSTPSSVIRDWNFTGT